MENSKIGIVALAAGGTGGHLFPAEALASKLSNRGFGTVLFTDSRAKKFGEVNHYQSIHLVTSGTFHGVNLFKIVSTGLKLIWGIWQSILVMLKISPNVVIGFGGFPSVPPLVAARILRIPTIIHEANAKMGRANRFLSKSATAIALSITGVAQNPKTQVKITETGNPVRTAVINEHNTPYPNRTVLDPFDLLVFGGSQGARFFSDTIPDAIALLSSEYRSCLRVVQQCRSEDIDSVRNNYKKLGISAEINSFFSDLPKKIAQSHLVICRAGASTISELTIIGRPSVLIPLPNSIEKDQLENAKILQEYDAARLLPQDLADLESLKKILEDSIENPEKLFQTAQNAKKLGNINATENLAKLVEQSIHSKNPNKCNGEHSI